MKEANTSIFGGPHPATQEPLSESAKAALFSPLSDAAAEALSRPAFVEFDRKAFVCSAIAKATGQQA